MVDEVPPQPNYEELALQLNQQLKEYAFFSDQVRFNVQIFQGINMILEKITKIEERMNGHQGQVSN